MASRRSRESLVVDGHVDVADHAHNAEPLRLPHDAATYERAAAFFRAIGDGARLKLIVSLLDREWCVTELAEAAGETLSTVSQRLRVLRSEGLVSRRRKGKHVYYALADDHVVDLLRAAIEHAAEPRHGSS